jgi:hypothetical protein
MQNQKLLLQKTEAKPKMHQREVLLQEKGARG